MHDFLKNHKAGETDVYLHADNCGGQNKNNLSFGTSAGMSSTVYMRAQRIPF